MRTLNVEGELEVNLRDIVFGADGVGTIGERVHLIVSPGIWSMVVEIITVSGSTGRMKGVIRAVCPEASLSRARVLGEHLSERHGIDDL